MCANRKKVTASGALTGGIVGNITNGAIENCYDTAIVYGNERVGGIAGGAENSTIEHCFVKAPETNGSKYGIDCGRDNSVSDGRTGGLTGTSNGTGFDRCFWYSSCAERGIGDVSSSGRHSGSDYDYYYYQVRFKNKDNTLEITDCYSGIAIESNVEDDATHGGFVAVTGDDSNVKIEGCVFGGELLGPASGGCGGIVGYYGKQVII